MPEHHGILPLWCLPSRYEQWEDALLLGDTLSSVISIKGLSLIKRICLCWGYEGDGRTCTQINICAVNNGGCYPLATCSSSPGKTNVITQNHLLMLVTFTVRVTCNVALDHIFFFFCSCPLGSNLPICTCPPGYTGNGYGPTGCTQTSNICQTNNPCVNGQCVVSFLDSVSSYLTMKDIHENCISIFTASTLLL